MRNTKFPRLGLAGLLFVFGASAQTLEQAESLWKQRRYFDANEVFKVLEKKYPQDAKIKARYGHMMLERHQEDDAADLFGEALKIDKNNAQALLGMALIAATKGGTEKNATIFARFWAEALREPAADTDKNETVSAMEAFRYAQKKTSEFFETQKRLATEHSVLEDSGKGEGERDPKPENGQGKLASAFPVVRIGANAAAARDPAKRQLLDKKEQIENAIDKLKFEKAAMDAAEYKKQLTALLLELAKVQEELDK